MLEHCLELSLNTAEYDGDFGFVVQSSVDCKSKPVEKKS